MTTPTPPPAPSPGCAHQWTDRGSPGDHWRECWLCGTQEDTDDPARAPHPEGRLVRAADLCAAHIGADAWLPGETHTTEVDSHRVYTPRHTWAPITMITAKKDGTIKVRRHPDAHVDHTLSPADLLRIRHQPRPSALDDALRREENLREELEDAWAKVVAAAEPGSRITDGKMPPFVPATWLRAILDDTREDLYDIAVINARIPAAEVQSTIIDVLLHHDWADETDPTLSAAHGTHHYDGRCAVCRGHWERVATAIWLRFDDLT